MTDSAALALPAANSIDRIAAKTFFMTASSCSFSNQDSLDTAVVRRPHVLGQPLRAEYVARNLHDDVVGIEICIVVVALQALHARRARSKDLHFALEAVGAQARRAGADFLLLAEAYLSRDVGPRHRER